MLFYRFEDSNKLGVYLYDIACLSNNCVDNQPEPEDDFRLNKEISKHNISLHDYIFGFKSPKQIFKWFNAELFYKEFSENKIILSVYSVPVIIPGSRQCIVHKNYHTSSNFKRSYNPLEYFHSILKSKPYYE